MSANTLQTLWGSSLPTVGGSVPGVISRQYSNSEAKPNSAGLRKVAAPRQDPGGDFVGALGHGLALLECWRSTEVWLSNADLVERSGLQKSTVSRLASVLVDLGYLTRDRQRGRLRLTLQTLELGFGSAFASEPLASVHDDLERLASDLDVYVALGIRRLDKVQVLDNAASPLHPNAVPMDIGGLLPICRSASGLATFSALPDTEAQPLVLRLRSHYGARWQTLEGQLNRTKQEYLNKGFCTAVASLSRHVAAVAVPIVPEGTDDIFVLGCGMSATHFYRERVESEIVPQMQHVAERLQAVLTTR
ncbi:MAG: IclR family transcriptional regulator [Pigmentiphaga sp.]